MYTYQTDRPISAYIRQACRAYVRERIRAGDYRYTGTDPEVARLFPDGEALCDDDAYACFVSHLENNPLRTQIACDPEPSTDAVSPAFSPSAFSFPFLRTSLPRTPPAPR